MKKVIIQLLAVFILAGFSCAGSHQVVTKQTGALAGQFHFDHAKIPATCQVDGALAGVEVITLQVEDADGTWRDIVEGGTTTEFDVDTTIYGIYAVGTYRFDKDTTVGAVGLICNY